MAKTIKRRQRMDSFTDLKEMLASQIFDYDYSEDDCETRPSEEVCNAIGERIAIILVSEWGILD